MIQILETNDYHLLTEMNEEVQSLHHKLYPEIFKPYDKNGVAAFFKEVLSKDNVTAFAAMENKKVLGYVLLFVNNFPDNPFQYARRFVILDQILVLENSRSKGVGKLLIEKSFSFAKSLDIDVVELNHWTLNESARVFFNRHGFKYFNEKMSITL